MEIAPAVLVREVSASEPWEEVVNEAKAVTWVHRCEVALIRVHPDAFLLVRGGRDGVAFEVEDDGSVWTTIDGTRRRITLLAWHTHPRPTGPSDHDKRFLRMLKQPSSRIYEMFGDGGGFLFYAEDREVAS